MRALHVRLVAILNERRRRRRRVNERRRRDDRGDERPSVAPRVPRLRKVVIERLVARLAADLPPIARGPVVAIIPATRASHASRLRLVSGLYERCRARVAVTQRPTCHSATTRWQDGCSSRRMRPQSRAAGDLVEPGEQVEAAKRQVDVALTEGAEAAIGRFAGAVRFRLKRGRRDWRSRGHALGRVRSTSLVQGISCRNDPIRH